MKTKDLNAICEINPYGLKSELPHRRENKTPEELETAECKSHGVNNCYHCTGRRARDPDALPDVDAGDLESHPCPRQWAFGIPGSYRGCDVCGEAEMTRTCERCGHHARIIDCGHHVQPTEIAWCHDTRRDLCQACAEGTDPDALPDVDAGDVESHAGELRTVRRAWVSGVAAEVEDCGNGHYDVILRADRGEDLLHFVGGSPDEGAIHATFSLAEICTLASLLTSFPPISEALRSPSLHPAPPPTPGRGGAREGEDGDAAKAASDLMADLARENMHLTAEIENLRAQILAIGPRLDKPQCARPRRADGRRRWGSALWAVACRELLIGDVSRQGTKYAIWLNDEEEALVRLWVEEYHGRQQ